MTISRSDQCTPPRFHGSLRDIPAVGCQCEQGIATETEVMYAIGEWQAATRHPAQ